jgi:hypothetical protein
MHISQRIIGKGISRWIPVFGAMGASAYAYYDTSQVGRTAIDFFTGFIDVEERGRRKPASDPRPQGARLSAPLPDGRALADESVDTLAGILGHHVAGHHLGRILVRGVETHLELLVEHLLAHADGDR